MSWRVLQKTWRLLQNKSTWAPSGGAQVTLNHLSAVIGLGYFLKNRL